MEVSIKNDDADSCQGCQWYHEWFGICCNGESELCAEVSRKCAHYTPGDPLPGVGDI